MPRKKKVESPVVDSDASPKKKDKANLSEKTPMIQIKFPKNGKIEFELENCESLYFSQIKMIPILAWREIAKIKKKIIYSNKGINV